MDIPVITIDGPTASGKGTICRMVAEKLSWHILDSGALGTSTSTTVSGLPTDGSIVYVRLWYYTGGSWEKEDFQYIAFGG